MQKLLVCKETPIDNGLCFYESILICTYEFLHNCSNFENYTSVHLKYDILMFVIKNFHNTQLPNDRMVAGIAQALQE